MDQLKALDSLFLDLETENVQANIGGVAIFDGPAPKFEDLLRYIESQIDSHPRYRQHLKFPPLRLGGPVWADDPNFDIERHVVQEALPEPRGLAQLTELHARFGAEHLDRDHSLWQIHFVEKFGDDQWAICMKVHHAMADGIAATDLLSLLLTPTSDVPKTSPRKWQARPAPTREQLLAETLTSRNGPTKPLHDLASAAAKPRAAVDRIVTATKSLWPIGRSLVDKGDSPINGPIGPNRRWAVTELDLARVKAARKAVGGTVNDIVLTSVTNGLRALLESRGETLNYCDTRTMVPVSIRVENEQGELDNQISAVFVDLPVCEDDPVKRFANVQSQMDHLKETDGAVGGEALFELAGYVPPMLFAAGERLVWRVADTQRLMNTVTTNVPGPQIPLYCMGSKMKKLFPFVMLPKNIRIATAIFSYDGGVYFGVTGDYDSVPDLQIVCDGIEAGLTELENATAPAARKRKPRGARQPKRKAEAV